VHRTCKRYITSMRLDCSCAAALRAIRDQAINDKNAIVASSALVSGISFFNTSPDVVRRWNNEVQEALSSSNEMVQFHALALLYQAKQHDRLAVTKLVAQLTKGTTRSPLAVCLLIR
jgi:coatomer subunit gamma